MTDTLPERDRITHEADVGKPGESEAPLHVRTDVDENEPAQQTDNGPRDDLIIQDQSATVRRAAARRVRHAAAATGSGVSGPERRSPSRLRNRRPSRQGRRCNLLNPKSVLFAAAVLVAVFPAGIGPAASLVIVVNHFLVEVAFYTALALCLSTDVVARRYLQAKAYIDRFAAAVLGALGLRLLWSRADAP